MQRNGSIFLKLRTFKLTTLGVFIYPLEQSITLFNFTNRYVWIDWSSMPQPSACPPDTPKEEKEKMGTDLSNAFEEELC